MSEREWRVTASQTVTAEFIVWAEDEDEAREQIVDAWGSDFELSCSDASKLDADGWDVTDVSETKPLRLPGS